MLTHNPGKILTWGLLYHLVHLFCWEKDLNTGKKPTHPSGKIYLRLFSHRVKDKPNHKITKALKTILSLVALSANLLILQT